MIKLAPAAHLARHTHPGDVYGLSSDRGCRLFVKVGHLASNPVRAPMATLVDVMPALPERTRGARDKVIEADEHSFPASDPPAWIGSHAGAPVRGGQ